MKEREEERRIGFLAVIFVRFGVGVAFEREGRRENFARPRFFSLVFAHLSDLSPAASLDRRPSFFSPSPRSSFHKSWVVGVVHFLAVLGIL